VSQAVGAVGLGAGAAASSLVAEEVGGSASYGPIAMGALVIGSALAGPAAASVMRRRGRVAGLMACYFPAALGALVIVQSVYWGVAALLVGSVLLGAGTTGAMLGRYVAADLVPEERRSQAMGLAVGSLTAGAIAGPLLLGPASSVAEALGLPGATGLHLVAIVVFPLAALICLPLRGVSGRPPAAEPTAGANPAAGSGGWWAAGPVLPLAVMATGNLSMVAMMGAAPNHLQHHDWSLTAVGVVMAAHIGGMFVFSPVSAALTRRFGARRTACAAALLMAGTLAFGLLGAARTVDLGVVVLAGAVWNLHLVSGSAWLIESTPGRLRHRAEGLGEFAMGTAAALGTFAIAGPLIAVGGLAAVCAAVIPVNLLAAAVFGRAARAAPSGTGAGPAVRAGGTGSAQHADWTPGGNRTGVGDGQG
jgi:MFS family permease